MKSYTVSYIYEIIYKFICEIIGLLPIHCIHQASKLICTCDAFPAAEVLFGVPAHNSSLSRKHIKSKVMHTAHLCQSLHSSVLQAQS